MSTLHRSSSAQAQINHIPAQSRSQKHTTSPTSFVTTSPSTSLSSQLRRTSSKLPVDSDPSEIKHVNKSQRHSQLPHSIANSSSFSSPASPPFSAPPLQEHLSNEHFTPLPSNSCHVPSSNSLSKSETHPFISILPRRIAQSPSYLKQCETCGIDHDGSFGAGRFCSSRCARTVGGLAHRRKRLQERNARQRQYFSSSAKVPVHGSPSMFKRSLLRHPLSASQTHHHVSNRSDCVHGEYRPINLNEPSTVGLATNNTQHKANRSLQNVMSISALLNPS